MGRQSQPAAVFRMRTRSGVPLHLVHDMLVQVHKDMGGRCGEVVVTEPVEGVYYIIFYLVAAADLFETIYRSRSGSPPERQRGLPEGVKVAVIQHYHVIILMAPGAFVQLMRRPDLN